MTRAQDVRYTVFVLGEIGRSPRMQYHALSLAKQSTSDVVDVVGFEGPQPHQAIREQSNIHLCSMNTFWYNWTQRFMRLHFSLFLVFAPVKILLQFVAILFTLLFYTSSSKKRNIILVQNPPAIPTLIVVPLYIMLMRLFTLYQKEFDLVVDWHNYAHTLMVNVSSDRSKKLGPVKRLILAVATAIEMKFGKWFGNAHLCVSKAMKDDLKDRFGIKATVLHDRPPLSIFRKGSVSLEEQHDLYKRVFPESYEKIGDKETTLSTMLQNGKLTFRDDKPALVVSSTSWTPDEDFGILLKAIQLYDQRQTESNHRRIQFVITGKGPQKEYYKKLIQEMSLQYCSIKTPWLESEDYPKLLACCDLGVCLHYSSSGIDLPMKVVDMFGSGIPVCAIGFKALSELVKDKENGLIFHDSQQLSDQLYDLFVVDTNQQQINQMKKHIQNNFQKRGWDEEWSENALPLHSRLPASKKQKVQ